MDTVGKRIKRIREMRGWTQKALAERAGIHVVTLRFYESGTRFPKEEHLQKVADALYVDISFLQPTKTRGSLLLHSLLFDLMDEYGDIVLKNQGGTVLFGINRTTENLELAKALQAHEEMSVEDFKKWLIDQPPLIHNGKIVDKDKL